MNFILSNDVESEEKFFGNSTKILSDDNLKDVTSIVNFLENGNFIKTKHKLSNELSKLLLWTNKNLIPALVREVQKHDAREFEDYFIKVKQIKQRFAHLYRYIKTCKQRKRRENFFKCVKCDDGIPITDLQHEHFEKALSNLGKTCNYICNVKSVTTSSKTSVLNSALKITPNDCKFSNIVNFKFNFPVTYCSEIENYFYIFKDSLKQTENSEDYGRYVIQVKSRSLFTCLICCCDINLRVSEKLINIHVAGNHHLKRKVSLSVLYNFKNYHLYWMQREPIYQSYQAHFLPATPRDAFCQLCSKVISYDILEDHIKVNPHKDSILISEQEREFMELVDKRTYEIDNSEKMEVNSKQPKEKIMHEIIKSFSPNSELETMVEHRHRSHFNSIMKFVDERIYCQCCAIYIEKHHDDIFLHIISDNHKILSKIEYVKYSFFCEICNVYVKPNLYWLSHLVQRRHVERLAQLSTVRKETLAEYECKTCLCIFFGDKLSVKRHSYNLRKKLKKKDITLNDQIKKCFESEKSIKEHCAELVNEAKYVALKQDDVSECCKALEKVLCEKYPDCKVYPFGSRVSGLGNKHSDLDIFVDVGQMYLGDKDQDPQSQRKFVNAVSKILRKNGQFKEDYAVATARTPIVQVIHRKTNLDCDLSFRHGLSVENTKYLRLCMGQQPVLQSVILILKHWMKHSQLNEYITTYALSMMVIFYFQVRGFLRPVHEIMKLNVSKILVIDGWEVVNFSATNLNFGDNVIVYTGSIRQLLKDFFLYYSNFAYATDVICPLLGKTIKKSLFVDKPLGEDLPPEMVTYVNRISSDCSDYFRAKSILCIQDPFDLSHNLTKACTSNGVEKFKVLCELMYKYLNEITVVDLKELQSNDVELISEHQNSS